MNRCQNINSHRILINYLCIQTKGLNEKQREKKKLYNKLLKPGKFSNRKTCSFFDESCKASSDFQNGSFSIARLAAFI